mgnify:CR=1 FL=1
MVTLKQLLIEKLNLRRGLHQESQQMYLIKPIWFISVMI